LIEKLKEGQDLDILKTLSVFNTLTIASPFGIPINLNMTNHAILKLTGRVKVNNMPSWSDIYNRRPLGKMDLDLDIKPTFDTSTYFKIGADMRWLKFMSGIEVHGRVHTPLKYQISLDTGLYQLTAKKFLPKTTVNAVHLRTLPATLFLLVPTDINKLPFIAEIKPVRSEEITKFVTFEKTKTWRFAGVDMYVKGQYVKCGPNWCPILPIFGKNELLVELRPTSAGISFIILTANTLNMNPFSLDYDEDDDVKESSSWFNYRTVNRDSNRNREALRGEFDNEIPDPIFDTSPWRKEALIILGNSQQADQIRGHFTWFMEKRFLKNQFILQVIDPTDYTPISKVKFNTVFNPTTWLPVSPYNHRPDEFLWKLKMKCLPTGGEEKVINTKLMPGSVYEIEQEFLEHGLISADSFPKVPRKYKYTLETEFSKMTKRIEKYITKSLDVVKFLLFTRVTVALPPTLPTNKVIIVGEFMPRWEKMNFIIKSPREVDYIVDAPLVCPLLPKHLKAKLHDYPTSYWYKNETELSLDDDNLDYKTSPIIGGECILRPHVLTTFDGVSIPWVEDPTGGNCEVVALQDCSEMKLFSLILSGTPESRKLRILLPKSEIHLTHLRSSVVIKVNGVEKRLHASQPIVIKEEVDESSEVLYRIEKLEGGLIELKSRYLGLKILINPITNKITVKVSPLSSLQGQLCGLCGNFNYDQSDDLFSSKMTTLNSPYDYFMSQVIPSDTCDVSQISRDSEVNGRDLIVNKRLTIQRSHNGRLMKCVSENSVPQCEVGYTAVDTRYEKVCFTCENLEEEGDYEDRESIGSSRSSLRSVSDYDSQEDEDEESRVTCSDFGYRVRLPTSCESNRYI
jgi:hypothetical protein